MATYYVGMIVEVPDGAEMDVEVERTVREVISEQAWTVVSLTVARASN